MTMGLSKIKKREFRDGSTEPKKIPKQNGTMKTGMKNNGTLIGSQYSN